MANPTLSVVIPAYNEVDSIGFLLESLASELDEIEEIIVVDNGSTDGTQEIVAGFTESIPQLRMVDEDRRGVIAARNAGFYLAKGDIIGRLDADARAKPGWASAVRDFFGKAEQSIGAGTGFFDQYDMPLQWFHKAMLKFGHRQVEKEGGDIPTLFGANMAIRKETWDEIQPNLLERDGILDDLDITLCMSDIGQRAVMIPGMEISASGRRMLSSVENYRTFTEYMPATFEARGMHDEAKKSWGQVRMMRIIHRIFWLPTRCWNPETGKYSLRQLVSDRVERVLPYETKS
ncbi:glycosyltransferase family 2 protein [Williamsia sp. 1135]|uniref:glycosyltransferase family 2 protein n=1 Tax=Williamsia sp. 1135 TaxID=1889262 RepID=UPI00143C6B84|nr:glycosyltransferase family 2 protein [Williamsia sp. 1135]